MAQSVVDDDLFFNDKDEVLDGDISDEERVVND